MKTPVRAFAALLCVLLAAVPAFRAAGAGESAAQIVCNSDTVSVSYYNTVKIFSGFTEGETFGGTLRLFESPEQLGFIDMGSKELITDADAVVYSGAMICLFDGASIEDMGLLSVFGDVNGDGRVATNDARLALRHASGVEKLGAVSSVAADVDLSGKVNSTDARRILRAAAKLERLENPIGNVTDSSVPVEIRAYYVGDDPEAGTVLKTNSVKVVAVYSDARSAVVPSGYTIDPDSLTSAVPGRKTFTVTWQGLTAEFTVNFTLRTPASFYPDSNVPDYTGCTGVGELEVNYYIGYITYTYAALDDVTDLVRFNTYMSYLEQCGFDRLTVQQDREKIVAAFMNEQNGARTVLIYDFSGDRIYVAVYQ